MVERKEEYKQMPSKFLVDEIEIMEINSEFCTEIDLLNKILMIQRLFRKRVTSKNKNKMTIDPDHVKTIENHFIEIENHVNYDSLEETKFDLNVRFAFIMLFFFRLIFDVKMNQFELKLLILNY